MSRSRLLPAAGLVGSLVLVTQLGCGATTNTGNAGRVSGRLTYKGQPLKAANMAFQSLSTSVGYNALVSTDGTYSATDIAVGEMVVVVETETFKGKGGSGNLSKENSGRMAAQQAMSRRPDNPNGGPSAPPPENLADYYVKIPSKYNNPKTSPQTIVVKPGRQVIDIDLTD